MICKFIKYVFAVILSFRRPLAALKLLHVSLDNQQCMIIPTLIDLNPDDLRHSPFMATLERCDGSCEIDEYLKNYAYIKNVINDSIIT